MFKNNKVKIIAYATFLFLIIYGLSGLLYSFLSFINEDRYKSLIVSGLILLLCAYFIFRNKLPLLSFRKDIAKRNNFSIYIIFLIVLFIINNSLELKTTYSNDIRIAYLENLPFYLVIYFPIRAIGEEILYRGLIQNYIDSKLNIFIYKISLGNFVASILMTLAHLGFFYIMPFNNALSAVLLVVISSVLLGLIYTKSNKNIFICIITHILLNYIHVFIHCI